MVNYIYHLNAIFDFFDCIFEAMRVLVTLFSLSIFTLLQGHMTRGTLRLESDPQEIINLISHQKIMLENTRAISNYLTNVDILEFQGFPLPKRKKAFMRHIKHLNEQLEWAYLTNETVNDSQYELLYELTLFYHSFQQAAIMDANVIKSRKEQIEIYRTAKKSLRAFSYHIPVDLTKMEDVRDSPYWHYVPDSMMHKQFDKLAKEKKIKAKKQMIVLFDGLSYSGSAPKVKALDLDYDNEWSLKWGDEVHTDVLGSRIFSALGYDVDHPYFYGKDELTLVFPPDQTVKNAQQLKDSVLLIYDVDLTPFISAYGEIDDQLIKNEKKLKPYFGYSYVRFLKCAVEGRPDRVKRIGSILPNVLNNDERRPLRAALLVHAFIGNWDTREENTCLTTVHDGDYNYCISAIFSDLGTSFGVKVNAFPPDFKVGLVNEFGWEVFQLKRNKIVLKNAINSMLDPYLKANYNDLKWMALQIAELDAESLKKMISETGWPAPIAELYFHKLASRRANIIAAFQLEDPHPISYDRHLTLYENGQVIIEDGNLVVDYKREENPESFIDEQGRIRNYGN